MKAFMTRKDWEEFMVFLKVKKGITDFNGLMKHGKLERLKKEFWKAQQPTQ